MLADGAVVMLEHRRNKLAQLVLVAKTKSLGSEVKLEDPKQAFAGNSQEVPPDGIFAMAFAICETV